MHPALCLSPPSPEGPQHKRAHRIQILTVCRHWGPRGGDDKELKMIEIVYRSALLSNITWNARVIWMVGVIAGRISSCSVMFVHRRRLGEKTQNVGSALHPPGFFFFYPCFSKDMSYNLDSKANSVAWGADQKPTFTHWTGHSFIWQSGLRFPCIEVAQIYSTVSRSSDYISKKK